MHFQSKKVILFKYFPLVEMHESVNMVPIRKKEGPIMSTKNVIFSNPGDVIDFVKIVEKYPFDMDMKRGRYIVDAKSLLGLMNLGFDQKIELKVYDEECDDLWKELDKFVAA